MQRESTWDECQQPMNWTKIFQAEDVRQKTSLNSRRLPGNSPMKLQTCVDVIFVGLWDWGYCCICKGGCAYFRPCSVCSWYFVANPVEAEVKFWRLTSHVWLTKRGPAQHELNARLCRIGHSTCCCNCWEWGKRQHHIQSWKAWCGKTPHSVIL